MKYKAKYNHSKEKIPELELDQTLIFETARAAKFLHC